MNPLASSQSRLRRCGVTLFAAAATVFSSLATAETVAPTPAPAPQAAYALTGSKWRTTGTFKLFVRGSLVMGGEAPIWLTFKDDGSIIADGDSWFVRWGKSGSRTKLLFNTKVIRRELGEPSSICYVRKSLSVSGNSIKGDFDGSFKWMDASVRFTWKFSGRR